jgi:predicted deacylase
MKTTVELPDAVLVRAKTVAIARKTTLRQLILNGLLRELQSSSAEQGQSVESMHPVESLRVLESDLWADVKADQYVESQRQNWL